MRKILTACIASLFIAAGSTSAMAIKTRTVTGAAIGAGVGAVVAGPPGAVVGGVGGAIIGSAGCATAFAIAARCDEEACIILPPPGSSRGPGGGAWRQATMSRRRR